MRLLTHNHLVCVVKGCKDNFPLIIEPAKVEQEESEVNEDFIRHILPRVDYPALASAAKKVGFNGLPDQLPDLAALDEKAQEELIQTLHTALVDTFVMEGNLVCPKCGRHYPIRQGIPNMLLNETEVPQ